MIERQAGLENRNAKLQQKIRQNHLDVYGGI